MVQSLKGISEEILRAWEEKVVPSEDLFFFVSQEQVMELMPEYTLVIPRDEFANHNSYQTIDIINSYEMWKVSKDAKYVCVVPEHLFPTLEKEKRRSVLRIQHQLGRGLIYEWEQLKPLYDHLPYTQQEEVWTIIESYIIEEEKPFIVFQKNMWSQLPYSFKRDVLIKIADLYTDESIEIQGQVRDVMEQYPQIIKYANCFSANNGANCLAATLAAATEEIQRSEWIIHQWIHPETFKLGLKLRGYEEVEITLNHLLPKDVLVWGINNIHHTAFHLGDGLFFNKNGQFFFNSWQILGQDVLLKIWGNQDIRVYRKISSHY